MQEKGRGGKGKGGGQGQGQGGQGRGRMGGPLAAGDIGTCLCPKKAQAEALLKAAILEKLNERPGGQLVMFKLTLPEQDDLYADCVSHPNVVRVVALSGGYTREEAKNRLRRNHGIVASFSRALVEGLSAQQSDTELKVLMDASIQSIFEASNT
jgi:fructose-bisphosphate aldolase, class I